MVSQYRTRKTSWPRYKSYSHFADECQQPGKDKARWIRSDHISEWWLSKWPKGLRLMGLFLTLPNRKASKRRDVSILFLPFTCEKTKVPRPSGRDIKEPSEPPDRIVTG